MNTSPSTRLGPFTRIAVLIVAMLAITLLRDSIQSVWLRALLAAAIAGGFAVVVLLLKRIRNNRINDSHRANLDPNRPSEPPPPPNQTTK